MLTTGPAVHDLLDDVPVARTVTVADLDDFLDELAAYHARFAPFFRPDQRAWADVLPARPADRRRAAQEHRGDGPAPAGGRAGRRPPGARRPVLHQRGRVGRRRRAGRPPAAGGRDAGRGRRGAAHRRQRRAQAGPPLGRGRPPVVRGDRQAGQLPGRRLPRLRQPARLHAARPPAVPAGASGSPTPYRDRWRGLRHPGRHALPDQARSWRPTLVDGVLGERRVRARWVACDEGFGDDPALLDQLAAHGPVVPGRGAVRPAGLAAGRAGRDAPGPGRGPGCRRGGQPGAGRPPAVERLHPDSPPRGAAGRVGRPGAGRALAALPPPGGQQGAAGGRVRRRCGSCQARDGLPGPEGWLVVRRTLPTRPRTRRSTSTT